MGIDSMELTTTDIKISNFSNIFHKHLNQSNIINICWTYIRFLKYGFLFSSPLICFVKKLSHMLEKKKIITV